jgi:hypothetical protein
MATHHAELTHGLQLALLHRDARRLRAEVERRLVRLSNVAVTLEETCAGRDLTDPLIAEAWALRSDLSTAIQRFAQTLRVLDAALEPAGQK